MATLSTVTTLSTVSRIWAALCMTLALASACSDPARPHGETLAIAAVSPAVAAPLGGSRLVISGTGLSGATVRIGGLEKVRVKCASSA